jgi:hypothetical protein
MLNTLGEQIVMDWMQKAVMDGQMFHVRAGTVTTPIVGDAPLADTAAEMCADAAAATTIIPVHLNIAIRLGTGTLHEYAAKSVATVSSAGTAFTPLNVRSDGSAAVSTARAQTAGQVTVTAELATTTLRHWAYSQPIAMGAYNGTSDVQLLPAPVLVGPRCFYLQIAATGTGPSYYASFDYVESPTNLVEL